jgi:hypothetical protein
VAGYSNFLFVGFTKGNGIDIPTTFALQDKEIGYQNMIKENLSYGIALAHLMASIDFIRLGVMPWVEILNDAKLNNI